MQCFILAMGNLALLLFNYTAGVCFAGFTILLSITLNGIEATHYGFQPMGYLFGTSMTPVTNPDHEFFYDNYQGVVFRMDVYFAGLLFGKNKNHENFEIA